MLRRKEGALPIDVVARRLVHRVLRRVGYELHRYPPHDFDEQALALIRAVERYTRTSPERILALRDATRYVVEQGIPGAIVESGVWRGGSMMAVALTLIELGDTERELYLFDTYEGMTEPSEHDTWLQDTPVSGLLTSRRRDSDSIWMVASIDEVRSNLASTEYPKSHLHLIEGPVQETVPTNAPGQIALLRLDTDWYDSTRHEMEHLYPRVAQGGVLFLDDYGFWQGARQAVDEYFDAVGRRPLLARVDDTARVGVVR